MGKDQERRTPVKCTRCGAEGEARITGESYVQGNPSTTCPFCGGHMT